MEHKEEEAKIKFLGTSPLPKDTTITKEYVWQTTSDFSIISAGPKATDNIMPEGIREVKEGHKISFTYAEAKLVASPLKVHSE